jgi:hypothetical protein
VGLTHLFTATHGVHYDDFALAMVLSNQVVWPLDSIYVIYSHNAMDIGHATVRFELLRGVVYDKGEGDSSFVDGRAFNLTRGATALSGLVIELDLAFDNLFFHILIYR